MSGVRLVPLAADRRADVGLSNLGRANAFLRRAGASCSLGGWMSVSTSWPAAAILNRGTPRDCTCALGPDRRQPSSAHGCEAFGRNGCEPQVYMTFVPPEPRSATKSLRVAASQPDKYQIPLP